MTAPQLTAFYDGPARPGEKECGCELQLRMARPPAGYSANTRAVPASETAHHHVNPKTT